MRHFQVFNTRLGPGKAETMNVKSQSGASDRPLAERFELGAVFCYCDWAIFADLKKIP